MSMTLSLKPTSLIVLMIIGGLIGFLGGSAIVLIPWALVNLVIGAFSKTKKVAIMNGAVYGFALAYVFMLAGYNGEAPVSTKILPFIIFGVIGAMCGAALALVSFVIRNNFNRRPTV
jgi:uncharacterized membrane protein (UPF0136 family)